MRTGIVLGGGGIRCFAHLGVLRALEEAGIRPDVLSGASSGSIIGAFIASGRTTKETLELLKKYSLLDLVKIGIPKSGLLTLDSLERNLSKHLTVQTFEELKLPLYVSATNLYKGGVEYISRGPLASAVKASCAIPFLFSPVEMNGQLYVDGGLLDDMPYAPLLDQCDFIIVSNIARTKEINKLNNLKDMALRVIELVVNQDSENAKRNSSLYIEIPGMEHFRMFDTRYGDELFRLGYEYTKKLLDV